VLPFLARFSAPRGFVGGHQGEAPLLTKGVISSTSVYGPGLRMKIDLPEGSHTQPVAFVMMRLWFLFFFKTLLLYVVSACISSGLQCRPLIGWRCSAHGSLGGPEAAPSFFSCAAGCLNVLPGVSRTCLVICSVKATNLASSSEGPWGV